MTGVNRSPISPHRRGDEQHRSGWIWGLALILLVFGILLADHLAGALPLFAFTLIPVVVSSVLGRPVITVVLSIVALASSIIVVGLQDDPAAYLLPRLVLIGCAGIVATAVAVVVGRLETRRADAFDRLARSEERYRVLAENSVDVVTQTDPDSRITYVSPSVEAALGYRPEELIGRRWDEIVSAEEVTRVEEPLHQLIREPGTSTTLVTQATHRDGSLRWFSSTIRMATDREGRPIGLVASTRDVTTEIAARTELAHRAQFDELTDLLNRREAIERLTAVTTRHRSPGDQAAILFIDLDGFKAVNDGNGHAAGDGLLRAISQRISETVRAGDIVARMGGDEFVVLLDGLHDLGEAESIAEKIRVAARQPVETTSGPVAVTVSIGIAPLLLGQVIDDLLATADEAMYEAKRNGGDQIITLFSGRMPTGPR